MVKLKKTINTLTRVADTLAMGLVVLTVNSACIWHYHQPEIPAEALVYCKCKKKNG